MKKVLSTALITLLLFSAALAQNKETRKVDTFTRIAFRVPGKLFLRQGSPQSVVLEGSREFLAEVETEVDGDKLIIGKENRWMDWNWGNDDRVNVYITVASIEGLSVSGSGDLIGETRITASDLDLNVSGSGSLKIDADATGDVEADVSGSGSIELTGKCRSFDSDVSGSGRVRLTETIAGKASFGVSGSGKIEASGSAQEVKTSISGSGRVYAANLEADRCEVRISGSGDVEINVKSELDATISGSGSVSYKGNPSHVNSHASGSGKVRKL
jgi:Putative auto-transporter adhesin, head GIN domain